MLTKEVKDSGVEWIGELPVKWKVVQVKHIFNISRGRVIGKEELIYNEQNGYPVYSSQTKNNGVLGYIATYDYDSPQLTWTTDGANAGTVFIREGKYNCTNICGTLMLKQDGMNLRFLYYALYIGAPFYKREDTNGFKIMNNEMSVIKLAVPKIKVQEIIVNILDRKINTVDKLIYKTKDSIEELKKFKQAIITEAVTKGLDPNVEMKDSRIEWIEKIPNKWSEIRIKYLLVEKSNKTATGEEEPLSMSQIHGIIPSKDMETIPNPSANNVGKRIVKVNDLVFNKLKAHLGVFDVSRYDGLVSPDYAVYQVKDLNNVNYLEYLFKAPLMIAEFIKNSRGVGAGLTRLYTTEFFNIKIPIPAINTQNQIVSYLNKESERIKALIEDKEKVIEELEQYKKSLIYEYVTGKREV